MYKDVILESSLKISLVSHNVYIYRNFLVASIFGVLVRTISSLPSGYAKPPTLSENDGFVQRNVMKK